MRHKVKFKVGDLVVYKGSPALFEGIHVVLDIVFLCVTVQNISTGAIFQADTQSWKKLEI
jgi:hypothetical protein